VPPEIPSSAKTSVGEKTVNSKSTPPNTPIPTREDLESENITSRKHKRLIGMIFFEKFKNMFQHMVCLEKNSLDSDQVLMKI
jgi:hypothetical protein